MGFPEIADFASNFAVMVRVQGPDPKGLKMRKHAFHHYKSGETTLSASGMILPESLNQIHISHADDQGRMPSYTLVITVASVLEPFLSLQHRNINFQGSPKLIPGAHIDVMVEDKRREVGSDPNDISTKWFPAILLKLVDITESSLALQSLIETSSASSDHGWEVGWSLASYGNDTQTHHQSYTDSVRRQELLGIDVEKSVDSGILSKTTTRIAILCIPLLSCKDHPNLVFSSAIKKGDVLLAIGSPFGILSSEHFYNSVSVGFISNWYPSRSSRGSLLLADIRCLPGMDGAPVFGEHRHLVGILVRPLRQKNTGVEVQLVIPWEIISNSCTDIFLKEHQNFGNEIYVNDGNRNGIFFNGRANDDSSLTLSSSIEKAMSSVCLVSVGNGIWASGVFLNNEGLILTNAHLLEPWRFKRTGIYYGRENVNDIRRLTIPFEQSVSHMSKGIFDHRCADSSFVDHKNCIYNFSDSGHRNIRVRIDHIDPWIWCNAKVVYISQGPLDIALLKIDSDPSKFCPIIMEFACPSPGSKAFVIGHGLFGPGSDILPSVSGGVVAKVVKSNIQETAIGKIASILETTAAVHPGSSGGAIVNSEGHMIGLVTSNARHGGGTVIPHLNFSIPCALLEPISIFSKGMQDLGVLQCLEKINESLTYIWALMPPVPYSLPKEATKNQEKKGSGFAQKLEELCSKL